MLLGEVDITPDGILHGWCWCPDRPAERLTLEILIDEDVVATVVASRFREDLRHRRYGDGYHGFTVTLTKQLVSASRRKIISARECQSGRVFWHKLLSEFSVPQEIAERIHAVGEALGQLASQPDFAGRGARSKAARVAAAFGALGQELQGHHGAARHMPKSGAFIVPVPRAPDFSLIFDAGAKGARVLHDIRMAAASLGRAQAEIILTDDGADPQVLRQQRAAQNLKYVLAPGSSAAARRNQAGAAARGLVLVYLDTVQPGFGQTLQDLHEHAGDRILISADLADAMNRIAPHCMAGAAEIYTQVQFERALVTPKDFLQSIGGFDERMDDGSGLDILDWVLRAAHAGAPLSVWRAPASSGAAPGVAQTNTAAGHVFAERWVMGQA